MKTGCGNLHLLVSYEQEIPKQVFALMAKSGTCANCFAESVARLITLALQHGASIDEISRELLGLRCPSPVWHEGRQILSCPDAIALALQELPAGGEETKNTE